jgi:hypothetical protein
MLIVGFACVTAARAQTDPMPALKDALVTRNEFKTFQDKIEGDLAYNRQTLEAILARLEGRDKASSSPSVPPSPTGPVTRAEVEKMQADLVQLNRLVREGFDSHQILLDAVSARDTDGTVVPRLRSAMQKSPQFRQEMTDVVLKAMPRTGTLVIENNMPAAQLLRINGQSRWIGGYSTVRLQMPAGTVSTELVGYEAAKNWLIGSPDFMQRIVINPQPGFAEAAGPFATIW